MRFVCVLTTAPRLSLARKLADLLVKQKLVACISLIPSIESHYYWKGKKEKSSEVQLIMKTTSDKFQKIEAFLKKNHPYEVPELISLPVTQISKKYAAWMKSSISKD